MRIDKIYMQQPYVYARKVQNNAKNSQYQDFSVPAKLNVVSSPVFTGFMPVRTPIPELVGHIKEKEKIYAKLIKPIILNQEKPPGAVLIYSPTKEVTNLFTNSVYKKLLPHSRIVEFDEKSLKTDFKTWLWNTLQSNANRSTQDTKHNIILIRDAEKYLALPREDSYYSSLTSNEMELVTDILHRHQQLSSVFKSLMDYCSEPTAANGYATTFLLTSENPHLIDRDLLKRPGKFLSFAVNPESSSDIAAFFEENVNQHRRYLKNLCSNQNLLGDNLIPYPVVEKVLNEKTKLLSNLNSSTDVPYHIISEFAVPNSLQGGYSYNKLSEIARQSVYDAAVNDKNNLGEVLAENIRNTERDISAETYANFKRINDFTSVTSENLVFTPKEIYENMFDTGLLPENLQRSVNEYAMSEFIKLASSSDYSGGENFLKIFEDAGNRDFRENFNNYVKSRIIPFEDGKCRFYYGNKEDEIIDLYLGSFGWVKHVLWVESGNQKDISLIKYLIDGIRKFPQFEQVKFLDFPKPKIIGKQPDPLARITIDGREIERIPLKD